jgi:thioredoxin-like negative regulator of GroEL
MAGIQTLIDTINELRQEHLEQKNQIEQLRNIIEKKEHYVEAKEPEIEKPHDQVVIHEFTDDSVTNLTETTILLFHTPMCPHCVTLKPIYTFMAPILIKRNITVGMIDGSIHRKALKEFNITGVPTIVLVHKGEKHTYSGKRVLNEIVHWVQSIVTNVDVHLIKSNYNPEQ